MKKKILKNTDDGELVTKGFLREELDRRLVEVVSIIMGQLEMMREENRAFHRRHDHLEKRVREIEIAP